MNANLENLKIALASERDPALRECIKLEILRAHWAKIHGQRRILPTFAEATYRADPFIPGTFPYCASL